MIGFTVSLSWRLLLRNKTRFGSVLAAIMLGVSMSMSTLSIMGSVAQYSLLIVMVSIMSIIVSMVTIAQSIQAATQSAKRDYSLLLSLGSGTGVIRGIVFTQTMFLAIIGSIIGVWTGWRVAVLSSLLLVLSGFTMQLVPVFSWSTVILCVLIGIAATGIASLKPAMDALVDDYEDSKISRLPHWSRTIWIILVTVFIGSIAGMFITAHYKMPVIMSLFVLVLGSTLYIMYPWIVYCTASITQRLFKGSMTCSIAMGSIMRTIKESAAVSVAYSVSIILVAIGSVLASGTAATLNTRISESLHADTVVYPYAGVTINDHELASFKNDDSVSELATVRSWVSTTMAGAKVSSFIASDNIFTTAFRDHASAKHFKNGEVVIGKSLSRRTGWVKGSVITLNHKNHKVKMTIGYVSSSSMIGGSLMIPEGKVSTTPITALYITFKQGIKVSKGIENLQNKHQLYWVLNKSDVTNGYTYPVYENLLMFYALVSLVVTISFFGLIATAILSVMRRRQELAVLMVSGMSRAQMFGMLAWQSTMTTAIGGFVGMLTGSAIGYAWDMATGMTLGWPWFQLVWLFIVSLLFGMASMVPAWLMVVRKPENAIRRDD
jgi:putative ABC transport system permease protein